MNLEALQRTTEETQKAMEIYPDCRIANCDCDSKNGKWDQNCLCSCHFFKMDEKYGKGNWSLADFGKEAKAQAKKGSEE